MRPALRSSSYAKLRTLACAALALGALGATLGTHASERSTVCAITVNSADEREVLRRALPAERYEIVELVARGRADWLAEACRAGVRCDALVISGHFDGGVEFYSDRYDQPESLPLPDLEQAACDAACPGLFGSLKEVYLFGCNTLNAEATTSAGEEIGRGLVRAGRAPSEAASVVAHLDERVARSNRDRMRLVFQGVPAIYGFASKAPLGHAAAPLLARHLASEAWRDVASGRVNAELVRRFAPASMTTASGIGAGDPLAAHRRDVCRLADPRASLARKAAFVGELLGREIVEVRALLDRLEAFVQQLPRPPARTPALAGAVATIAADREARARFLDYARGVDVPRTRVRMLDVAYRLGWLSREEHDADLVDLMAARIAAGAAIEDIDLACELNRDGRLDRARDAVRVAADAGVSTQALLGCLGSAEARAAVLAAPARERDEDLAAAEVLLHHRPLADAAEARAVAARAERAGSPGLQARLVRLLQKHADVDEALLAALTALYRSARTLDVQQAVAALLVRADLAAPQPRALARTLRAHRLRAGDGRDAIDVLLRRLERMS